MLDWSRMTSRVDNLTGVKQSTMMSLPPWVEVVVDNLWVGAECEMRSQCAAMRRSKRSRRNTATGAAATLSFSIMNLAPTPLNTTLWYHAETN